MTTIGETTTSGRGGRAPQTAAADACRGGRATTNAVVVGATLGSGAGTAGGASRARIENGAAGGGAASRARRGGTAGGGATKAPRLRLGGVGGGGASVTARLGGIGVGTAATARPRLGGATGGDAASVTVFCCGGGRRATGNTPPRDPRDGGRGTSEGAALEVRFFSGGEDTLIAHGPAGGIRDSRRRSSPPFASLVLALRAFAIAARSAAAACAVSCSFCRRAMSRSAASFAAAE